MGFVRMTGIPYHPVEEKPVTAVKPQVSNAKRVDTRSVAELRKLAKARKAPSSKKEA